MRRTAGANDCAVPVINSKGTDGGPFLATPVEMQLRRILRSRAIRKDYFDRDLFADSAWDILLELYNAELERKCVSVPNCRVPGNGPAAAALRQIGKLVDRDLVVQSPHSLDPGRQVIRLSEAASGAMQAFLAVSRIIAA